MSKTDYKREQPELYTASAKTPALVTVPALNFLMIDGRGDPNTSAEYQAAVEALFAVAYALKFAVKRQTALDYGVLPLEGLWWVDDLRDLDDRAKWQWTMMIRQPAPVTAALVRAAVAATAAKRALSALPGLRFEKYAEGRAAQVLHRGPYSAEQPTIAALHAFIHAGGHQPRGRHHEIYLSDARRTAPAKLKTILRQPVEKAGR
ncbi:MAG: GyrI-like domain-containing protein [Anaerolineales bacterium]|nr:GyrI-like domain-containing protein [Anaerolineales bacterium]